MKGKSKKVLIVLCSIVLAGLVGAGLALAFVLGYNPYQPNELKVIDDGKSVYVYADMNDNYDSYRFKFENAERGDLIVDSTKNLMTSFDMFRSGVEMGVEYKISVSYINKDNTKNSWYSDPITWKTYAYLESPVIVHDNYANVITWGEIENADYYEVHYNYQTSEKVVTTEENSLNLQQIDGGQRDIYVVAKSNSDGYRPSIESNTLTIAVVHEIENFATVSFSETSKVLTLTSNEIIRKMRVIIGATSHEYNTNPVYENGKYNYTIDITEIYEADKQIGVSALTYDEYNVYTSGQVLYLQ